MKSFKFFITSIFIILCRISTNAMNTDAININNVVCFILSDTTKDLKLPAEFPGGQKAWVKYLEKNMDYDLPVKRGAPIGEYDVIVSFIISKDGSITNINTENNPGYGMQEEVIRVITNAPKWNPASINGVNVIYRHRQSIRFSVFEK